jgi:hypothetical protein
MPNLYDLLNDSFFGAFQSIGGIEGALFTATCFILINLYQLWSAYRKNGWHRTKELFSRLLREIAWSNTIIAVVVFSLLFGYQFVKKSFDEYKRLTSESQELRINNIKLRGEVMSAKKRNPQTIVRAVTALPEPRRCWLWNYPTFPNPSIKEATDSVSAIVFCNQKTEAPFDLAAQFNEEMVQGTSSILDAGVVMGGAGVFGGKVLSGRVNAPSLLPYQPVVFLAHAKKKIRAERAVIKTSN